MIIVGLVALSVCGCWEKIEYTSSDLSANRHDEVASPTSEQTATELSTNTDQTSSPAAEIDNSASQFADELSNSTIVEPPVPSTAVATAEPSDDRYAVPSDAPQPNVGALPVSATVDVPPAAEPLNSRRTAWLLGSKLSLAALAHDRGLAPSDVPTWFAEARSAAESLQTSVAELPQLPATSGSSTASREIVGYLLDQGRKVSRDLAAHNGPDHDALFEVAMKSNLLLVLYKPDSPAVEHIATAIRNVAPRAGLPPELWQPLLDTLASGATPADVRAAVRQLHADVDAYLAAPVEP